MSPAGRLSVLLGCISLSTAGCNWLVSFVPFEQCESRPGLVMLAQDRPSSITAPPQFQSTAGCTIVVDVRQKSILEGSIFDGNGETNDEYSPLSDHEYEVWVEPLEPDGRVETGVLGADGRVMIPTSEGHASVTLTVYLPDDRVEGGVVAERMIVLLNPPS